MKRIHRYAIKYIDNAGFTTAYGYAESLTEFREGEIIALGGQRIKIDFELARSSNTDGHIVQII